MARSASVTGAKKHSVHSRFYRMADIVPEGKQGDAEIVHFTVGDEPQFRAILHPTEYVDPGAYAQLRIGGAVVMSDTRMEQRSNIGAVLNARGDVLIGGLGLGMILLPILEKPDVQSVLVIERNQNVIDLVLPHLQQWLRPALGRKLAVVAGDVLTYQPAHGRHLDFAYMDIWTDICEDNLEAMKQLHLKYRRHLRKGGRVTSWEFDRLRDRARGSIW